VRQIIEGAEVKLVLTEYESPGTKETFVAHEGAGILSEKSRIYFHSTVAKLLYLAKRAWPDILTVVTYLCTRVQHATVEDERKLGRVLGYLKGTVERTLLLKRASLESTVAAHVDVAYALHGDSKSHTGVVIYVGGTLAYVALRKQKCMSKSPTEAELVALTDNLGLVELFQEFVEFVTKKRIAPPLVYQDCNAVVTLVTKGGGKLWTKHLRARMHLGKEMVDEGRIVVVYKSAEGMEADGFSKPYDPAKHKPFAAMIQGESKAGQQVGAMQNRERSQVKSLERSRELQSSGAGVDNKQNAGNV